MLKLDIQNIRNMLILLACLLKVANTPLKDHKLSLLVPPSKLGV